MPRVTICQTAPANVQFTEHDGVSTCEPRCRPREVGRHIAGDTQTQPILEVMMDPTPKKVQRQLPPSEASVMPCLRPNRRPGRRHAYHLAGAITGLLIATVAMTLGTGTRAQAAEAPPAEKILPPDGNGITLVGEPMVYFGEELYDYINGAAPHFIEYGFEEVASQELQFGEHTYIFDVYRMADPLSAFGLFTTRAPEGAPMIGVFPNSSLTAFQGLLVHGPYFFDTSAYETGPWVGEEIATLVNRATTGMPPDLVGERPRRGFPLGYLPVAGRLIGSEKLARGPVSLRAALGSAAGGSFWTLIEQVEEQVAQSLVKHSTAQRAGHSPTRDEQASHISTDQEPSGRSSAGGTVHQGAWWVVAGYHPLLDEMNELKPQTTLAMLVDAGDLSALTKLAEGIADNFPDVRTRGGGRLWSEKGRTGYVLGTADRLFFVTSSLDFKTIESWAARLLEP